MKKTMTKQKILEAAISVFAEKGYNGASTREIAAIAGVSEGSVFKHFATKRDILLAVLDSLIDMFADEMTVKPFEDILKANEGAPPEKLFKAIALDRIELFRQNSELLKIILTESLYDNAINRKFFYAVRTKLFPALHELFGSFERDGLFREMGMEGAMVLMRTFISMLTGYALQRSFAPALIPVGEERDLELMINFFINGVAK